MTPDSSAPDARNTAREILGYLNFSNGAPDPAFLKNLNTLYGLIEGEPAWEMLGLLLEAELQELQGKSDAFGQVEQAKAIIPLVFDEFLFAYREHHQDLLFHQPAEFLFQPLFIGRVCEAVLQQAGPWNETERIIQGAVSQINDSIGHRPVAVLETEQKIQPYTHEWVRPIPLWIRGAGVSAGPYAELIEKALGVLNATDSSLLFDGWFDPNLLDELAVDPRAYDFDHPVNKRPNYLFGQWDLNHLDNSGRCRRFVVQQVSLDAMLARIRHRGRLPYEEVLFEEAAVLAGTMLMGSGVSGNRPDAHSSDATLGTLVQHIARYRDEFYDRLIERMESPHVERLRLEAVKLHQPFGGARQDFNHRLGLRRAEQSQHVHLAQLFARMGNTKAAARQIRVVPVASARILCDIYCRLAIAQREIKKGGLDTVADIAGEIVGLLHRGIECGAIVDPWNMLGFGGQYPLFPAVENSIHDHRIDDLIDVVCELFGLYVQIEKEAAAAGNAEFREIISGRLQKLAAWWDPFASTEVGSVEGISGRETRQSADHVAAALGAWHEAGTAAGDIAFWPGRVQEFQSPKAYALVVEALLQQRDLVAAMALLIQWLSQSDHIPLVEESYAFHDLALSWMENLWRPDDDATERSIPPQQRWDLTRKFFDYLEANAEDYWEVPRFELAAENAGDDEKNAGRKTDDDEDLFGAAYEDVTYHDSTDDGFDGETFDGGYDPTDFELLHEADRVVTRLGFLSVLAQLWRLAATASAPTDPPQLNESGTAGRDDVLAAWLSQAMTNRRHLLKLLAAVDRYHIPAPRGTQEALIEYDHRRGVKETLLEQIIATCVETVDAGRMIHAAMRRDEPAEGLEDWEVPAGRVLRSVLQGDVAGVRAVWQELIDALQPQPLLYVALARGGDPGRIVASRTLQCLLRRLLTYLPRLGLLGETNRLIQTVQEMELDHPVGHGAITEFDRMFQIGCKAIVRCLVVSSSDWYAEKGEEAQQHSDVDLIAMLEQTSESLLRCWLVHSRGVRLSVLEAVNDRQRWQGVKEFIERFGSDLFTQRFMNLGNLRAILHEGADAWLQSLDEEPGARDEFLLLRELERSIPRSEAARHLDLILEAVVENYNEYIDYNSTTTQSDRGEMLYTLLDFLRLRVHYDRVAWNLLPVVLAHEVLVRGGREEAAGIWRRAIGQRTREIAEDHQKRLAGLVRKHGIRLPSIADRIGERFVRPLAIDRLRAMVAPAVAESQGGESSKAFAALEKEIGQFTKIKTGAGFDIPPWLDALGQEIERIQNPATDDEEQTLTPFLHIPQVRLSLEEAERQVRPMMDDE